jgi:hypothetical protein
MPVDLKESADLIAAMTDRIHTACLTVASLPGDGPRTAYTAWPAYRHDWWDWGNEASRLSDNDIARRLLAPPRFTPTPKQVDDCLPALRLLDGVDRTTRLVVSTRAVQLWYAPHRGWRDIGRAAGCSHESARRKHWAAMVSALSRHIEPCGL